ncbi:MAG TPA: CidA/LrgA family protein [Methanosarcina sp.]|nr:CidA/LrgA family protein [Methanosarcina sp.]
MLKQFSIILSIYFLGELLQKAFELPVPGNILGMLILFISLYTGIIKLEMIDRMSNFLLDNLAFFFLPAGVSLITCFTVLEGKLTEVLWVSILSTIIILGVTGLTVEFVKRFTRKKSMNPVFFGEKKDKVKRSRKEVQAHEKIQINERKVEEVN